MEKIVLRNPIDLHVHLREGFMLNLVAPFTTKIFSAAVAMPNLLKPVRTAKDFKKYNQELESVNQNECTLVQGIMLTPETTPEIVKEAYQAGARFIKNIPKGISTNACGVPMMELSSTAFPALRKAQELGMVFSSHCEVIQDKNMKYHGLTHEILKAKASISALRKLADLLPSLKIVVEHINCWQMISFVSASPDNIKGTLTCHHALLTWGDVWDFTNKKFNPFNFFRPVALADDDRSRIIEAMTSDEKGKFALASDSAPHFLRAKREPNSAAGVFTEPVLLPLLAQIFEDAGRLEKLQKFVSPSWAPDFYGFTPKPKTIVLEKEKWTVPVEYEGIPIFMGGKTLNWQMI